MRRFLAGTGVVLATAVVGLALLLVPAHLQIRRIDPPIPASAAILGLRPEPGGPLSVQAVNTASQGIAHPGYLLEWPGRRVFLIDAGMDAEGAREFGRPMELLLGADPIVPHGSVDLQIGAAAVREIRAVGFTHLHQDHTGGLVPLCASHGGRLELFQTRQQAEEHNYSTEPGVRLIETAGCTDGRVLDADRPTAVPGFPGLYLLAAGGHTPGSTIFIAVLPERIWIFSGDLTNTKPALLANEPKPWVYSWLIIPEATERLERLRRWLAELDADERATVVVAHDLDAALADGIPAWAPGPPR